MIPFIIKLLTRIIHTLDSRRYKLDMQWRNSRKDKILEANAALANEFSQKKCYVLGNSPSLNNHDLHKLENEWVFCVNTFFVHEHFDVIKPNFYVIADLDLILLDDEATKNWWQKMIEKSAGKGIRFFLPLPLKNTFVHEGLKNEAIYFLDLSLPFNSKSVMNFDITKPINGVQNVLILAIQLAIHMGFEKINLLGADHDWLSHYGKEQRHFYNIEDTEVEEVGATGFPYNWWLNAVNNMFKQYRLLQHFAHGKGIKIYNASESGVLDIFPYKRYKDTFND